MSANTETIALPATTREIQLASRPHGRPVPENFRLAETALPELQDGQAEVLRHGASVRTGRQLDLAGGGGKGDGFGAHAATSRILMSTVMFPRVALE